MMHEKDQALLEGGGGEEVALLHEQIDHQQQELEQAEDKLKAAWRDAKSSKAEAADFATRLEESSKLVSNSTAEVAALKDRIVALTQGEQDQAEVLKGKAEALQNELQGTQDALASREAELKATSAAKSDAETRLGELRGEMEEKVVEVEGLTGQVAKLTELTDGLDAVRARAELADTLEVDMAAAVRRVVGW